jgi:hypothetical protein
MDPRQKLALMDKVIRELDDLKKSQTSVLKKIAQIETDNINLGVDILSDTLPGIHENIDDAVVKISALLEPFQKHRDEFENDNKGALAEPQA